MALMKDTLSQIKSTTKTRGGSYSVPTYDKSLRGGRGDRAERGRWLHGTGM